MVKWVKTIDLSGRATMMPVHLSIMDLGGWSIRSQAILGP